MGRSVSTPSGAIAVCYRDVSSFGYDIDDEGNVLYDNYDWAIAEDSWDWFLDGITTDASNRWGSFYKSDEWVGREDRAILENTYAYIGVSEYCGLAAVWLLPKYDEPLAESWCARIAKNFNKMFGEYAKVGTFSNGESVYEKIAA